MSVRPLFLHKSERYAHIWKAEVQTLHMQARLGPKKPWKKYSTQLKFEQKWLLKYAFISLWFWNSGFKGVLTQSLDPWKIFFQTGPRSWKKIEKSKITSCNPEIGPKIINLSSVKVVEVNIFCPNFNFQLIWFGLVWFGQVSMMIQHSISVDIHM